MFCVDAVAEVAACFPAQTHQSHVELPVGQWVGVPVGTPVAVPAGATVWMSESPPASGLVQSDRVAGFASEVIPNAAAEHDVLSEGGVAESPPAQEALETDGAVGVQPEVHPAAGGVGAESLGAPMCKGWDSLAAQLCAQELEQVSYDFYWDGCLWTLLSLS